MKKIKNALISVSDKSGINDILRILKKYKYNILSSGGTYQHIKKLGFKCKEISEFTNFSEMLDGRVKTLHPKIHSGILFDRSKKSHLNQMKNNNFEPINLLIVNFYPFEEMLKKKVREKKIIENIDIGGPAMVRAAAKNFKDVTVITDQNDYSELANELKSNRGKTMLQFREKMASKAFNLTSLYDSYISEWFNKKLKIKFPEVKAIIGKRLDKLRYGENPHQSSAIYVRDIQKNNLDFKKLSGKELSFNNYNDIYAGLEILISDQKTFTTVIIKHANPCGVSINNDPLKSFQKAQASDPISAFGGVVACNYKISYKLAKEINKTFFEVILAKGFDKLALKLLKKKKNMRLIDISDFNHKNNMAAKIFDNSFLLQDKDLIILNKDTLKFVTKNKPSKKDMKEIDFAFRICKFVKSNAIVITNNQSTIGIGAGQQNRLDSCRIATQKAKKFQPLYLSNSVAASDAFFPFPDGIKVLIKSGVKTIIQPGGSIRDKEVIKAANEANVKMVFTGIRHFNH